MEATENECVDEHVFEPNATISKSLGDDEDVDERLLAVVTKSKISMNVYNCHEQNDREQNDHDHHDLDGLNEHV